VFVPTDEAIAGANLDLESLDQADLTAVLEYHVATSPVPVRVRLHTFKGTPSLISQFVVMG
jgi:hypothetical protein